MNKKAVIGAVLILALCAATARGQFARTYGGPSPDIAYKILTTPEGGFVVFGQSTSFSAGTPWLIGLAADGSVLWEKSYEARFGLSGCTACKTVDGGYLLAGSPNYQLWLIKTNALGEPEWQRTIPTPSIYFDSPYAVCPAGDSGYFAVGYAALESSYAAWVVRLSLDGDIVWQKMYDRAYREIAIGVEPAPDGGCVVAGKTDETNQGADKLLVFKVDAAGALVWQKIFSSPDYGDLEVAAIRRLAGGGYLLTGSMTSSTDSGGFVLRIDETGTLTGATRYGRKLNDACPTADGGSIVVAERPGTGGEDIVLLKLGSAGDIEWQRAFGGTLTDIGYSVVQTEDGGYGVAGYTISFGAGKEDFCVIGLPSDGVLGACRFSKGSAVVEAALNVVQADASLTVRDTTAFSQPESFAVGDTSGSSLSFRMCTDAKLLTIGSNESVAPGSTSPSLGTHLYSAGESVSLSALARVTDPYGTEFEFSGWKGDVTSSNNPIQVTVSDDMTVMAIYGVDWGGGEDGGGGGGTGKGKCFIATAAFKSPLHPAVRLLRNFRDRRLLSNRTGRSFVEAYYRWSPRAAAVIERSPVLRVAVRVLLVPVIAVAALVLVLGWPETVVVLAGLLSLAFRGVRRWLFGVGPSYLIKKRQYRS